QQGFTTEVVPAFVSVKEAVFPFAKFPGVDPILGPEMKSTGEVMGSGASFGEAYLKAQQGSGAELPRNGTAFISVRNADKKGVAQVASQLIALGFKLLATDGTQKALAEAGVEATRVNKVLEGRPHIVDAIKNGGVDLIVNTTEGRQAIADSAMIRRSALQQKVYYTTTLAGAEALCMALEVPDDLAVDRLQDLHRRNLA
ncbi:carbamoyl phosphate synthase large subunit, partial [bacterium]|nr:carbamoyl phosphate synthase large subunit [bacterium]